MYSNLQASIQYPCPMKLVVVLSPFLSLRYLRGDASGREPSGFGMTVIMAFVTHCWSLKTVMQWMVEQDGLFAIGARVVQLMLAFVILYSDNAQEELTLCAADCVYVVLGNKYIQHELPISNSLFHGISYYLLKILHFLLTAV